jgi:hypothetical protein
MRIEIGLWTELTLNRACGAKGSLAKPGPNLAYRDGRQLCAASTNLGKPTTGDGQREGPKMPSPYCRPQVARASPRLRSQ